MYPLYYHFPGSQESIAPNRFSKFDRAYAFSSLFRFSPQRDYIQTEIEIVSKTRVPIRISKNGLLQSIPESLKNSTSEGI